MSKAPRSRSLMRGSLVEFGLPDVMRMIYTSRLTGELLLVKDVTRRRVFFELGRAIFASSNRKGDRLGEFLLRRGEISQTTFELVTASLTRDRRFGSVLVEKGLISEERLAELVRDQILSIIYSLFEWTKGEFEFIERPHSVPADLKLDLSMADLILEGVRRIRDFGVVRRGLGDLNRLIGPSTDALLRLQAASLKPQERELLNQITAPTDILSILVFSQQPAAVVVRALYGLLSAGFLTHLPPPVISQDTGMMIVTVLEEPASSLPESVPLSESDALPEQSEESWRTEIEKLRARLQAEDPYLRLGLARGATSEQLQEAYYKLSRQFHPDRFRQASQSLREEVEKVFAQITQAYHQARAENQGAGQVFLTDSGTALRLADLGTGQIMEPSTPESSQRWQAEAEKAYHEGAKHLVAGRYTEAAESLSRAVRLNPQVAKYHCSLAIALSKNPQRRKEAEQHFLRAIQLDPHNAQNHALLGNLYAGQGMVRRAESHYRQSLKLDPNNQLALKGLEAQRLDKSLLSRFTLRK